MKKVEFENFLTHNLTFWTLWTFKSINYLNILSSLIFLKFNLKILYIKKLLNYVLSPL